LYYYLKNQWRGRERGIERMSERLMSRRDINREGRG
jgi:hypothetical protein